MDFKSLFLSAKGRIGRQVYWLSALGLGVANVLVQGVAWLALGPSLDDGHLRISFETLGFVTLVVVFIAVLVLGLSGLLLAIKRCHDRDRSGWFLLASLIPLVGPIWVTVEIAFLRGTPGPNRFGPDPLGGLMPAAMPA